MFAPRLGIHTCDIYALKIHRIDPYPLAVKQGSQLALFASPLEVVGCLHIGKSTMRVVI